MSSLPEKYYFLKTGVPDVTSDSSVRLICLSSSGKATAGGRGGGRVDMEERWGLTGGRFGGRGGTSGGRGPRGGREDGYMVYCYYCKEPDRTKHQCPF